MTTSFWLDEPYAPRPALDGVARADVAVLGGGVTGVAAAWYLRERGASVAVVDRGPLAVGATGRNAGFLLAGTSQSYAMAVRSHGRDRARRLWEISRENHRLLRGLVEGERIDCHYARNGSYTLALSGNEAEALAKSAKMLGADGLRADYLDDTEVGRLFPGSGFTAGLFHPEDGEIHPARFVRGLAAAAERRGARFYENSAVTGVEHGPSSVTLVTPKGRLEASMLLLATNAWTPLLHPFFEAAIVGMRGQMLATEPFPRRILPAPVYADFGFEYFRQLPDGRLLVGGGRRAALDAELTYAEKPSEPVQAAIETFFFNCFPEARPLKITHRWAGIMGFSCDELPSIGPVPGAVNVYAAAGYHGHGLGFAVAAAQAVAEMMTKGRSPLPDDFRPARHLQT
ncbi:MAG TPA: FAD-binding oxidoreductase [Planctomycetota bacterium]